MVVLEAWARGIPVVAHRIGALPEIIREGSDGLLVEPGDSAAMGQAILSILENPDRAAAMGEAGRKRLEQDFSKERWLSRIDELVTSVASMHRSNDQSTKFHKR
jgi:glycosyltransferase involved in cell wall biosynthesis